MPAFVKSSVGSSLGKTGALGTTAWPRAAKKARKSWRTRAAAKRCARSTAGAGGVGLIGEGASARSAARRGLAGGRRRVLAAVAARAAQRAGGGLLAHLRLELAADVGVVGQEGARLLQPLAQAQLAVGGVLHRGPGARPGPRAGGRAGPEA